MDATNYVYFDRPPVEPTHEVLTKRGLIPYPAPTAGKPRRVYYAPDWVGQTLYPGAFPDAVEGPARSARQEKAPPKDKIRPRRVNVASLEGQPVPEREWLVAGLIPARQVTLIYGDGATGKSLIALQLGAAVSAGLSWLGREVLRPGPVEFISAEDEQRELHIRLADIAREMDRPLGEFDGLNITSLADEDAVLAALNGQRQLVETPLLGELDGLMAEAKPALLVLDTLADVYGGDEIVRQQVRAFVNMLRRLAIRHGTTVVVLAHPSLTGMSSGKGTSGSTGWSNAVRSRLYFERSSDEDQDARVLRSMKLNYGRGGEEIGVRYCRGIFAPVNAPTEMEQRAQDQRDEERFLELLAQFAANGKRVNDGHTSTNYAPTLFAVKDTTVPKSRFERAMLRLFETRKIHVAEYGPPSRRHKYLVAGARDGGK